jgi:hypothetical protein
VRGGDVAANPGACANKVFATSEYGAARNLPVAAPHYRTGQIRRCALVRRGQIPAVLRGLRRCKVLSRIKVAAFCVLHSSATRHLRDVKEKQTTFQSASARKPRRQEAKPQNNG